MANYELKTPSVSSATGAISLKTLDVWLIGSVTKTNDTNTYMLLV